MGNRWSEIWELKGSSEDTKHPLANENFHDSSIVERSQDSRVIQHMACVMDIRDFKSGKF